MQSARVNLTSRGSLAQDPHIRQGLGGLPTWQGRHVAEECACLGARLPSSLLLH